MYMCSFAFYSWYETDDCFSVDLGKDSIRLFVEKTSIRWYSVNWNFNFNCSSLSIWLCKATRKLWSLKQTRYPLSTEVKLFFHWIQAFFNSEKAITLSTLIIFIIFSFVGIAWVLYFQYSILSSRSKLHSFIYEQFYAVPV